VIDGKTASLKFPHKYYKIRDRSTQKKSYNHFNNSEAVKLS